MLDQRTNETSELVVLRQGMCKGELSHPLYRKGVFLLLRSFVKCSSHVRPGHIAGGETVNLCTRQQY